MLLHTALLSNLVHLNLPREDTFDDEVAEFVVEEELESTTDAVSCSELPGSSSCSTLPSPSVSSTSFGPGFDSRAHTDSLVILLLHKQSENIYIGQRWSVCENC